VQDPFQVLGELVDGAETLSLAVSTLQVGGWELFRHHTRSLSLVPLGLSTR